MVAKWNDEPEWTENETRCDLIMTLLRSQRWPEDTLEQLLQKADLVMDWLNEKGQKPNLQLLKKK